MNIFLLSQIIIHKNSDGSTKWTSFSYLKSLYTKTVMVQQSEHLTPISNHYTQKQWRFKKWTSFSYLKSLYTKTVTVQQSEHPSPISNHYAQKQWWFNKVNIFLLSQIIMHKKSDGSTKWTSYSISNHYAQKQWRFNKVNIYILSQIIKHKNSDGSTKWTSFSYLKSLYTKTVMVQQSEHLSPISNHYAQKQWRFNKVNIFLLSQIIIHKNSDGSTKWTSYSYFKSLYTKTVTVQQSEHLSPISNHYTQKQWRFNKVNIFLLSQIIIHKNSDGSTKWTSFSYLKSLYTKTVMVHQSVHLSPISNHYTQKQWRFSKVNIFLLSQIIIHKNSDDSTKWTSFSYLKSLYTKTVTVQQSEHLSPISNHYTQKQWRFNKVNIFLLSQIIIHKNSDGSTKWTSYSISNHYAQKQWRFNKVNIYILSQIIKHKNSDGSTKWTSFSYLKSLYTKTVMVQQSEHLSPISNHYAQKQWRFNKVNILHLSEIIIHKNSDVQQSKHLSPISNHYTQKEWRFNKVNILLLSQIIIQKNSDGSTKWTSYTYLKSLYTKRVTVQQSEHPSPISNYYTQEQWRFNKVNIFLLSQIIIHKNSDGSTKWTSFSYLKSLCTKTVTVQQSEHLSPISNHYTQTQWWFNKVNILLLFQIIIHKNSDGSTKWTSFSYLKSLYTKAMTVQQSEHLSPISNNYTQKQWRFNKVNIFLLSQIIIHKNSDGSTKWTSFSYLKSLYTKTVTVQQSEHLSPISNHYTQKAMTVQQSEHLSPISNNYTQKQWRFNKVNIFLISQILIHKNSDGSTKWTSFSYLKSLCTKTVTVQQSEHLSPISNHYTQKQWRFNKVNIFLLSQIIIHKNSDGSTKWTSFSYLKSLYTKTVTVQQSEHLSPISNHYTQKQWRFNKVNIFLLSQIIIHKNSDGSTKWTSFSYLKSLYTKTVTVQQSEHLSPISNHYTQKQWRFNKVNIFLLSQIIIHKNSDGSTKWTSFSYLKSLYTKTVMVQQSEHLTPISNHYTQKQWRFNKVNIFLLSQIIIHKNSDGSTKWTSFSYLKSLYTKTVMVQQSEHLTPISNHYTQKQWRFNKVNIFLLSQIIIHKNSDGSTKWTSFSYLKSLYTKTVTVQQNEHLSPISNHYAQKQWRFNKVNIFLLSQIIIHKNSDGSTKWTSFSYLKSLYTKQWRFNKVNILLLSQIIIHKNSDGSTKWTSFSYLKSLYTKTVTVQQSEHLTPISNHYAQKQWRFNKVNIFLLSQIIIHKNSDGSTKWTSYSYLKSLYTRTVTVQQSEHLSPISNHYISNHYTLYTKTVTVQQSEHLTLSQVIMHKNSDGSAKWTSFSYLKSLYTKTVTVQQSEHLSPISNHYTQKQWRFNKVNIFLLSQIFIHKNSDGSTKWTSFSYEGSNLSPISNHYTQKQWRFNKVNIFLLSQIIIHKNSDGSTKWTSISYLKSLYTKTVTVQQSEHLYPISNHYTQKTVTVPQSEHLSPISNQYTQKQWRFNKVNIFLLSQIIIHKNSDGSTKWTSFSYLKSLCTKTVTVQQSEHLSPISNHYAQQQWWFNKVNIFLISQIIIYKNSDGSRKWTSYYYLKSLCIKTVMVQQSEHLSPISNHYAQKQWRFNKVNIFLLSQIIMHKNSDGSTKWTSFSYLKSLYTKTMTVQQSEHLSPISNHYTQKQWWFNKVNIFLLSQIIIHKNSDGSTKWTSFSYLKSLYTKTVTVQQSEHLSPISNHYTQKQWRFN